MTEHDSIDVYLAGAGFIARHHADATEALPVPVDLSVADPAPDALSAFAEEYPQARTFDDTDEMLAEPADESDIVVVATPPVHHHDITVAALESGRHVLCEKPLALDEDEARSMVETALATDRLLGCCSCRFVGTPTTDRVRELLATGALGAPFHATWIDRSHRSVPSRGDDRLWTLDRSVNGGGPLMEWGPYDMTTLAHVLEPTAVTVSGAWTATPDFDADLPAEVPLDVELNAGAALRFHREDRDVVVSYERTNCTHGAERSITELEGTAGAVRWDWDIGTEGEVTVGRDEGGALETTTETCSGSGPAMLHRPLVYFHQVTAGGDAPIPVNGRAGFNFACIRAIYEAAETGESVQVDREAWP